MPLLLRKKNLLLRGRPSTYATDFREAPIGQIPEGWVYRGTSSGLSVEALAGSMSGRALRWPANNQAVIMCAALPQAADAEALVRFQFASDTNATNGIVHVLHRVSPDGAASRYLFGAWNSANQNITKAIYKDVAGVQTLLASGTQNLTGVDPGEWVWHRSRCEGNNLRIKYWLAGTAEPANWLFEMTDDDMGRSGYITLVCTSVAQIRWIDYFAVSLDWSTLPVPP